MYTCSHLESWNPPANQLSIDVNSPNFFDERIIKEITEFKNVETASPDRMKELLEEDEANREIMKTRNAADKPPRNENKGSINNENDANPTDKTKTAPNAAPEDTPIMPGSAIGFLNTPCNDAPETAKEAPTNIDKIILGNLILEITFSLTGSISVVLNKRLKT